MNFNKHSNLEGRHAFLSPSNYHWINYSDEKLDLSYKKHQAVERGVKLHAYAKTAIDLRRWQPKSEDVVDTYINDAIGYGMSTEVPLYYSENCFGTADAIGFCTGQDKYYVIRVHDLKTGVTKAHPSQVNLYDALFCLEYGFQIKEEIGITIPEGCLHHHRIYQSVFEKNILEINPEPDYIRFLMNKIVESDARLEKIKRGE